MLSNHRPMSRWRVVVVVLGLAACTKPNPRSCADGTCTDPEFPFCDVGGELEGTPQTCIAVACDPGTFTGCRGDQELRCNTEGTDFDLLRCDLGCDEGIGCRLCEANETACTNGTVATCDANGVVTASEPCALGCFEDEPRCREISPSNDLASLLDQTGAASDLDLTTGTINTDTGTVTKADGTTVEVNTVLLPAPENGVPVRVLIVHSANLRNVTVVGSPALAILSHADVQIGALSLWLKQVDDSLVVFPGAFSSATCSGKPGSIADDVSDNYTVSGGFGGGGHATPGGKGGTAVGLAAGGAAGQASGSETLIPLRGGCGGPNGGGGAIQIVSRTKIGILDNGLINANGNIGCALFTCVVGPTGGGGAGGGILLEAPVVELGAGTRLLANGGPAGTSADAELETSTTSAPSPGGSCANSILCSDGGDGASADGNATDGADLTVSLSAPNSSFFNAGGGGGGLGFIRINTSTGDFTKSSDTIESGHLTTSVAATR